MEIVFEVLREDTHNVSNLGNLSHTLLTNNKFNLIVVFFVRNLIVVLHDSRSLAFLARFPRVLGNI